MNIAGALGGIANKGGASASVMPISPGELEGLDQNELKRFREMMAKYKAKSDGPVKIEDLSAYSLNQVQQSLDKYNNGYAAYKKKDPYSTMPRASGGDTNWEQEAGERNKYKQGSWGIEDEFRFLTEERDFMGKSQGMGIGQGGQGGQPGEQPGLKPGDKGYNFSPNDNYGGTQGSGLPGRNGSPGIAGGQQQAGTYDYSGYDAGKLSAQVRGSGQVSTGFYNKAYGQSVEQGQSGFGMADLEGNLGAGISSTQLKEWFDSGGSNQLGAKQREGSGGIYDQVAAAAAAEEEVKLESLPTASTPPKMIVPAAQVGNVGNASGVRAKRSNNSRYGRNSRGTSQFNRGSFGNPKTSSLTIGGLNI